MRMGIMNSLLLFSLVVWKVIPAFEIQGGATSTTMQVTGRSGSTQKIGVFGHKTTWFEANQICELNGYDNLNLANPDWYLYKVLRNEMDNKQWPDDTPFWTGLIRPQENSSNWYYGEICTLANDWNLQSYMNSNQQCAVVYMTNYTLPTVLEPRMCSQYLPFLCITYSDEANTAPWFDFHYFKRGASSIPDTETDINRLYSYSQCYDWCAYKPSCISFTYSYVRNKCAITRCTNGQTGATYNLTQTENNVTHAVKRGTTVQFFPEEDSILRPFHVYEEFPCTSEQTDTTEPSTSSTPTETTASSTSSTPTETTASTKSSTPTETTASSTSSMPTETTASSTSTIPFTPPTTSTPTTPAASIKTSTPPTISTLPTAFTLTTLFSPLTSSTTTTTSTSTTSSTTTTPSTSAAVTTSSTTLSLTSPPTTTVQSDLTPSSVSAPLTSTTPSTSTTQSTQTIPSTSATQRTKTITSTSNTPITASSTLTIKSMSTTRTAPITSSTSTTKTLPTTSFSSTAPSMTSKSSTSVTLDCSCCFTPRNKTISEEEMDEILDDLKVDEKKTSSSKRSKISVMESTPSKTAMGVIGLSVIVGIFGSVVIMDILDVMVSRK